jgi:hypothetical protein
MNKEATPRTIMNQKAMNTTARNQNHTALYMMPGHE